MAQGFDWRVLLSALSTAAPVLAQSRANRRSQAELQQGNAAAALKQREADELIGDEITGLAASNPEKERVQSLADYSIALRRSRAQPGASEVAAPNLGGDRFQADTKAAAGAGATYARGTADLVSRIDAPTRQREREHQSAARSGTKLQELGRESNTAQFLAKLRAQRQQANPWVTLLSQLGQQIGRNYEGKQGTELEEIDLASLPKRRLPLEG